MMTPADRELLIAVRSILLMAVDKLDRRLELGKYKNATPSASAVTASFSGIIESAQHAETVTATEQKG